MPSNIDNPAHILGNWIGLAVLKPSQNKKGRKNFQLHHFLNTFSQLPAVKKYSKNGAAGKIFCPSYFDPALIIFKGCAEDEKSYGLDNCLTIAKAGSK